MSTGRHLFVGLCGVGIALCILGAVMLLPEPAPRLVNAFLAGWTIGVIGMRLASRLLPGEWR